MRKRYAKRRSTNRRGRRGTKRYSSRRKRMRAPRPGKIGYRL